MSRTIQILMLFAFTSVSSYCADSFHLNNDARYQEKLDAILNSKPPPDGKSGQAMFDWLWGLSHAYMRMRRYDEMEIVAKAILAIYPSYFSAHSNLSVAYGKQGKYTLAIEEARIAALLCQDKSIHPHVVLCSWLYLSGQHEEAIRKFESIEVPTDVIEKSSYLSCKACFYASVGDVGMIKDSMAQSIKINKDNLTFFERDISFDSYRNEPWFIDLVGKTLADK